MKHEDSSWRLPKDWKPSQFDFTEYDWTSSKNAVTKGVIWLRMGVISFYAQTGDADRGMPAYSQLSMIKNGVLLERAWDRRYIVRYLVTLAKRWQADRWIALGETEP